jgi:hypothetical protein
LLNGGTGLYHSVGGNWLNNGTYDGGASNVTLTSATGASIGGSGNTIFHNLIIAGTDTAVSPFSVTGNFTNNGTFGAVGVNVSFTGGLPSIIGGTSTPIPFDLLTIAKNSTNVTLTANVTGLSVLTVADGTLQLGTFTASQGAPGGILTLYAATTLEIGGSGSIPSIDSLSFDPTSTVVFDGSGSQPVLSTPMYGNIVFSNTGTRTASGNLNIAGDISLLNGTFIGGAHTHTVGGNWTMSGGTFNNNGTTIAFTGSRLQTIQSSGNFNSLTVNKSSSYCSAGTNIAVNGTLTFASGSIFTGTNRVIIGPTGTISRTSGHVAGSLQKHIVAGNGSYTFEVGDTLNYTPVDLTMNGVVTAGDITATVHTGEYPNLTGATLNANRDVNRYWTLGNSGTAFSSYDAKFNFLSTDLDLDADPSSFVVHKADSTAWKIPNIGVRTSTSTQALDMTSFSDFCVGEILFDTIYADAGLHGSISPSGSIVVIPSRDTTFTFHPEPGYLISNVLVDGKSVGWDSSYIFTNVLKNHTISVTFGLNRVSQITAITPASAYRGQSLDIVVGGKNFTGTTITLNAPADITVNNMVVHSVDTIFANVTIGQSAAVGATSFTVTNEPPGGTSDPAIFTILNHPPSVFNLAKPADGDTVYITAVRQPVLFTWHPSLDLDVNDSITYVLSLPGISLGDTVKGDTSIFVNIMDMLVGDTVYYWSVFATDGYDTIGASSVFSFRTIDISTAVENEGSRIPRKFALHQNFPNPFNPVTTITYEVPMLTDVSLKLYNIIGQEVAMLVDEPKAPGVYSVRWDGSQQPSGIYFYTISAGNFHQTKRLMLVK